MMRPPIGTGRLAPRELTARSEPASGRRSARCDARDARPFPEGRASAQFKFTAGALREVRHLVAREARRAQLSERRREDLVLAIDELATNSVTHGGGRGTLKVWREEGAIACEVRDRGHIADPLVGQRPPAPEQLTGRGLWVVSQLCDRVQISSSPGRTAVRVQMAAR
jgi:anti-sigma regulatory factor (Ser/Thr protein kinase)